MPATSKKSILVIGVGNTLLKDEGVGVKVVERLEALGDLPDGVELLQGGVLGLDLLEDMEGREKIIIVDAVNGGETPGTIYRMTREHIDTGRNRCLSSVHEIDLPYVFRMADLLGQQIDPVVIIGIEPKDMDVGFEELSPEVEAQIPKVIDLVMKEIRDGR
jgi:hydrogenase maturation protease